MIREEYVSFETAKLLKEAGIIAACEYILTKLNNRNYGKEMD